jgi:opacity protein-like surface antigen
MISRTVFALAAAAAVASPAWAQHSGFEIGGSIGGTFSDGVGGSTTDRFGNPLARIDPKDAFSWNTRVGYMINENLEVGGLFSMQSSSLVISSGRSTPEIPGEFTLGDENLYNYHGYFAYNFGDSDRFRPYLMFGLGATQFGAVKFEPAQLPTPYASEPPPTRTIDGNTKFSTTWAAGLKFFTSNTVGMRLEARWTPTYIKSDADGWWCDPYWGCYTTGNAQYANQFEFGGGIALRF